MDLTLTADAVAFRNELRAFLADHLPPDWAGYAALATAQRQEFDDRWRQALVERRLLAAAWPAEYGGGGLPVLHQAIVAEEFTKAGVPTLPWASDTQGLMLIGPTLLAFGTDAQKAEFIPKILSGEHRWAQGFSEPGAGSDLAGLRTTARRVGDEWHIDGQKVWQTAGTAANWIYVLTRTNPDVPKHRGISMLLVPIDQPGVEVRPIRTMTGDYEFCEVFFDAAVTPADHVVGEVDHGWRVAMALLGLERAASAPAAAAAARIELDRLAELAREHGVADDPVFRERFAWCHTKVEVWRYLALRAVSVAATGRPPGAESSILKIYGSEYRKIVTELAMDVLGMAGTVASGPPGVAALGPDPLGGANSSAAWQKVFLTARAATIYGGSSQIQRNILAERILGLPR